MTDYFELSDLSLDDAMIQYAYNGYATVYVKDAWKDFKEFYECPETPAELFVRFWDDIMMNLNNHEMVRNAPVIAENLSRIHNPRTYPPRPPEAYDNVKDISLFEFKRQQNEAMQRKMFNDPKMLALKAHCLDYIKKLRAEPHTQSENIQVSTNRGSLHIVDQSALEQRGRPSSSDSRVGRMSSISLDSTSRISAEIDQPTMSRVSQGSANRSSMSGSSRLTMEQPVRRLSSDNPNGRISRRVSQDAASSSLLPGIDQSISRGSQKRVSRDSTSQRSTSERSTQDLTIVLDLSESTSESEGETPRKRRRSADVE